MARLLYRGCEPGMDVMELQECLNHARQAVGEGSAFQTLTVDGAFGPMTHGRVLEFQRGHALTADGVVGSKTWGMLEVVLCGIPGLVVNRPLGGGGNAGAGQGTQGQAVYGKPGTGGGPDVAGAAAAAVGAAGSAAGAAWSAARAGLSAWGSGGGKGGAGGGGAQFGFGDGSVKGGGGGGSVKGGGGVKG